MDASMRETLEQLRLTGKRALAFDKFVMRRAWGVYYAVWALAISFFIFLPNVILYLVPINLTWIVFPVSYMAVGILATFGVSRNFSNAEAAINLRKSLDGYKPVSNRNFYFYLLGWSALIALLVVLSVNFQTGIGFILITVALSFIDVYVYSSLKRHFVKVPAEGKLAVGVFAFSTVGSLFGAALTQAQFVYDILWVPTIAAWVFAALYTLYKAPEDLVKSN